MFVINLEGAMHNIPSKDFPCFLIHHQSSYTYVIFRPLSFPVDAKGLLSSLGIEEQQVSRSVIDETQLAFAYMLRLSARQKENAVCF